MKNSNFQIIGWVAVGLVVGLGLGIAYMNFFVSRDQMPVESAEHSHGETSQNEQTYTCSMHPQVRQNEPGKCPICGMDLIPLEENTSNDPLVLQMTEAAAQLANIQSTVIGKSASAAGKTIRLSGKVQTDERLAATQVAHVPGRIEKLFVSFTGEPVRKGQKLATIYSPDLITAQRELLEAVKLKELNPNLLEAARNKLRYWKIESTTIKAIEEQGTIQETFTLFADESGIVKKRHLAVGDYVKQGEPLFDLMSLSKVWVLFDAYEEDLAAISVGDQIEFSTPSLPDRIFKTKVTFIDPFIDPITRVASVRTEVNNTGNQLKPEMLVYGTLKQRNPSQQQLTVPRSAVLWTGTRSVVYVKIPDSKVPSYQFREVEIGERAGDQYQVLNGLEAGEEVVTHGSFAIDAAAQLNNQASMMNRKVVLKNEGPKTPSPDFKELTPIAFKQQLFKVAEAYLFLKDKLVATDPIQAAEAAQQINQALAKVDMTLVKNNAHFFWMEKLNALEAHSKKMAELNEVEEQRQQFDFLSQELISAVKAFGIPQDVFYVQHCPMAINDRGADWLSREQEIRNPYFGDKMLTCGLVTDTISGE